MTKFLHTYGAGVLCTILFLYGIHLINNYSGGLSALYEAKEVAGINDRAYRLAVLPGSADGNETKYHAHMKAVLKGCKDICRVDMSGEPSLYFDHIKKDVDCHALMINEHIDAPMADAHPPGEIPFEMVDAFTYGGRVKLLPWKDGVSNQRYMGNEVSLHPTGTVTSCILELTKVCVTKTQALTPEWTEDAVNEMMRQCQTGELKGSYDIQTTTQIVEALGRMKIEGASVLVIGSEKPWIEACALGLGAKDVTTVEYGGIQSRHPRIQTFTPDKLRTSASAFMERFDAVISYSSVEHSGLGRYGDAMNPWGDRQAIARAWCMTKPGGRLALGLPYNPVDTIFYNAHREYGPIQLPHILANWKQVWKTEENTYQHIWVCEK